MIRTSRSADRAHRGGHPSYNRDVSVRCWALVALVGCGGNATPPAEVLIYTRTLGYRHAEAITRGTDVLPTRLAAIGITAEVTEDPAMFEDLVGRRVIVFMYTSGDGVISPAAREHFEAHHRAGAGFVGLHSATDTEYAWPFYQDLIVAPFASHPPVQPATIDIVDRTHPAMAALPAGRWRAEDEWYDFGHDPADVAGVRVLATLDETTYTGGTMGPRHPIIWAHERLGGRAFYSALGHVATRWDEPAFVDHVVGAIAWAAGRD